MAKKPMDTNQPMDTNYEIIKIFKQFKSRQESENRGTTTD